MKSIPLVRNGLISPIIRFFDDIGTPIQFHLNQVNIPLMALEDPEIALPCWAGVSPSKFRQYSDIMCSG